MAKTVLITGTSTGIGAACVKRQAEAGWKVYAGVRKPEDGERLVAEYSGDIVPVQLDVTELDDIERVVQQIDAESGSLDGLVNNAGIAVGGPVEILSDEQWRWQMEVNFFGLVNMTREAMPLVDRAGGRFVHIGSIAGRVGGSGMGPYVASKHAVEGFNWSLRSELTRGTKMTSSVIEPGEIQTAIWEKAVDTVREVEDALDATGTRERYQFLVDGTRGFVEEGGVRGIEADAVAKAVEHALTARRPKARYLVGPDAKAAGHVFARLPDRAREWLLTANAKRMEKAGRKLR